jgi:hypothetical protein
VPEIMVPRDRILVASGNRTADTGIFRPDFQNSINAVMTGG